MIANVEFRINKMVPPDQFVLCNMEHVLIFSPFKAKVLCFINSDLEFNRIMADPTDFLKNLNELKSKGELPA